MSTSEPASEEQDTGLHQRTTSAVEKFADEYMPDSVKDAVRQAAPHVGAFVEFVAEKIVPLGYIVYEKAMLGYKFIEPYNPEDLLPTILGLFICFFGGTYLTLIAAVEAYRMAGWHSTMKALKALYVNAQRALEESRKDDQVDADGDGEPDVNALIKKGEINDVVKRKVGIVLRSVNPDEVTDAIGAINAGFLAVLATLKIQFAKAITLGAAIGDIITGPMLRFGQPILSRLLPEDLRKWSGPLIKYTCKSIAISLAWMLQRIISSFHSAIRGGLMASRGVLSYLNKRGIVSIDHEKTYLDEIVGGILAFLGFTYQFGLGYTVPFPFNILLLPMTMAEYFLMWMVNS